MSSSAAPPATSSSPAKSCRPTASRSVIDIDLLGAFNSARAAFEQLKVHTRQRDLHLGWHRLHAARVSGSRRRGKAGIDMLMKNLAIEWGPYGIRCNSIVPGPIEGTEGMKRLSDPTLHDQFIGSVPLRRMGTVTTSARWQCSLPRHLPPTSPAASASATAARTSWDRRFSIWEPRKRCEPKTQAASDAAFALRGDRSDQSADACIRRLSADNPCSWCFAPTSR